VLLCSIYRYSLPNANYSNTSLFTSLFPRWTFKLFTNCIIRDGTHNDNRHTPKLENREGFQLPTLPAYRMQFPHDFNTFRFNFPLFKQKNIKSDFNEPNSRYTFHSTYEKLSGRKSSVDLCVCVNLLKSILKQAM